MVSRLIRRALCRAAAGRPAAGGSWCWYADRHQVLRSSVAFYVAAGFTADGPSTVHRGSYQVVLVAENRDHSNTETNLAAGITRR